MLTKKKRIVDQALISEMLAEDHPCMACFNKPSELHHVKTVGSGGDDIRVNLIPLCRQHHTEWHKAGTNKMSNKYGAVKLWLIEAGWEQVDGKWRR